MEMDIKAIKAEMKRNRTTRAQAGGRARGWEERRAAIARYHLTPHFCQRCHQPIEVGDRRVADVIKKKFCGYSCSASHTNERRRLTQSQPAA